VGVLVGAQGLQTDIGGPSLLGLFASLATSGNPQTRVLRGTPQSGTPLGDVQTVSPDQARRAVQRLQND